MTTTDAWVSVCDLGDLVPERGAGCLVEGRHVALFRVGEDRVLAVGNNDPASGANVVARGIVGTTGGRWTVATPMYKTRFDLESGRCLDEPAYSLPVFATRVVAGTVYVAVGK